MTRVAHQDIDMKRKPLRGSGFQVRPHAFRFKPGVDLDRMNQLADELESEEVARALAR